MAASVALVAGLVLGGGAANAAPVPHGTHHAVVHSTTGAMQPSDWWW
jgi:hypothetical protein